MVGWLIFWILSTPSYQTLDDLWEKQKTKQIKTDQKQLKITHLYNLTPCRHCKFPWDKLTLKENKTEKILKFIINMLVFTRLFMEAPNDCFL